MKKKVIIIGASTVGKTTLLNYLKENYSDLPVEEADDVLKKLNGGEYPKDSDYKMKVLAPKMVEDVLGRDSVVFFSNTHYFKAKDLRRARGKGFVVMLLLLERKRMEERSIYRHLYEGYEDHTKYFDDMFAYQKEIRERGLVDVVVDTDRVVEEIADEILSYFKDK
jgi:GTPase SAR1 family protein